MGLATRLAGTLLSRAGIAHGAPAAALVPSSLLLGKRNQQTAAAEDEGETITLKVLSSSCVRALSHQAVSYGTLSSQGEPEQYSESTGRTTAASDLTAWRRR